MPMELLLSFDSRRNAGWAPLNKGCNLLLLIVDYAEPGELHTDTVSERLLRLTVSLAK